MNGDRQLERALPEILADLGAGPTPDYTRSLLARTARTRQRPGWVFPERWINVDVALRPLAAAPSARRIILLAAVLLIAAIAAAGLYAGSQRRVPAPFGLARNGAIVFDRPDAIYVQDSIGSPIRALISPGDGGQYPSFSPDGTRLVYLREHGLGFDLVTARADGSGVQAITPAPMAEGPWWWGWTPDSQSVAVVTSNRADAQLLLYDATRAREPSVIDTGFQVDAPAFRPGNVNQMAFRGAKDGLVGLYLMNLDGTGLRTLVPPFRAENPVDGNSDLRNPGWSPDGTQLTFHRADPTDGVTSIYVMDAESGKARRVGFTPGDTLDNNPVWSPDGRRIEFSRFRDPGEFVSAVVDLTTGKVTNLQALATQSGASISWTPDGTKILAVPWQGEAAFLMDPEGGPPITLLWGAGGAASTGVGAGGGGGLQRLAP